MAKRLLQVGGLHAGDKVEDEVVGCPGGFGFGSGILCSVIVFLQAVVGVDRLAIADESLEVLGVCLVVETQPRSIVRLHAKHDAGVFLGVLEDAGCGRVLANQFEFEAEVLEFPIVRSQPARCTSSFWLGAATDAGTGGGTAGPGGTWAAIVAAQEQCQQCESGESRSRPPQYAPVPGPSPSVAHL